MMGAAVFGRRRPFRVHAEVEKGDALLLVKKRRNRGITQGESYVKAFLDLNHPSSN